MAYVAVSGVVIVGFSALTIDLGRMYMARSELHRCTDSSALAAVSVYTVLSPHDGDSVARERAKRFAAANVTFGSPTALANADIRRGRHDFANPSAPLDTGVGVKQYNAVEVTGRCDGSINSSIPFLFARILGSDAGTLAIASRAVFDTRVAGFTPSLGVMTPFVICDRTYDKALSSGPDNWSYDASTGPVETGDGVREIHLFPVKKNSPTDCQGCPGNWGLLNIATGNQGATELGRQIREGVTPEEMEIEIGTPEATFFDSAGNPVTYEITGSPGIKTELEPDVQTRVGDIIGFFLYSNCAESGSNAIYTITAVRFGRLMFVDIANAGNNKAIIVQPVVYTGPGLRIDPSAPENLDSNIGKLVLVR